MGSKLRVLLGVGVAAAFVSVSIAALNPGRAASEPGQKPDDDPRKGQTYIGAQKCAACHFEQFTAWKQTKHSKAFEILPAKYKQEADCLKCHTTGHGEPTGYKDASTASLVGTSCEACHGPGSKHAEVTKQYAKKKNLNAEEDKIARGSTYRVLPTNGCIGCHAEKGHKAHPKYDKE